MKPQVSSVHQPLGHQLPTYGAHRSGCQTEVDPERHRDVRGLWIDSCRRYEITGSRSKAKTGADCSVNAPSPSWPEPFAPQQ